MLMPKRVKHRKWHRGTSKGVENRATELAFGSFGLKAFGTKWITAREIEAARRKGGRVWLRLFPDKPITSKGVESALGGGKGAVDHYVFAIRPGRIIFEIDGLKEDMALQALKEAASKLSVKTKLIRK